MRICLISNDSELLKAFELTALFEKVTICQNLHDIKDEEIVIISDELISHNELMSFLSNEQRNNKHFYYLLSSSKDLNLVHNIVSVCASQGVETVPPKQTLNQIVNRIVTRFYPENSDTGKIATFLGVDSKVGTTMIAQSVAESIAYNTCQKVGLFFFNKKPSVDYLESNLTLDSLKSKLFNQLLGPDELAEFCIKKDNLYVLPGPENLLEQRYYTPEHVENLIELSREFVDILIIDAGSDIDNGLTIGALNSATAKYLVITQQETAKASYNRLKNQVFQNLQLHPEEFMGVINKYIEIPAIKPNKLADQYSVTLAAVIPHMGLLSGVHAEFSKKTFYTLESPEMDSYRTQINSLTKIISKQLGFPFTVQNQNKVKNSFLSRIFAVGGVK